MTSATPPNGANGVHAGPQVDYDAIVVGTGFAGLRMIHELRKQGLSLKVIEAGSNVGGTWYWNRYPGARTDSESWVYIFNFSKELNDDWVWKERFPQQPEMLEYMNHVVDRFDMRKDIQFNTRVKIVRYDDDQRIWRISTDKGEELTSKYFVSATGVLSHQKELPFPGVEKFKGQWLQSGATGVQIIPTVAHQAAQVTVFQRTANYVLPARNHPLTPEQQASIKANYDNIWKQAREHSFGMPMTDSKKVMDGMSEKQIIRVLEYGWEVGGFRFVFETFGDLLLNKRSNDIAAEFVRNKIRSIVQDEETAELLCPTHAVLAKRPPLGHQYYETYNKPNVKLVDIKTHPIQEITETGIRTDNAEYEFDIIIYAIGFDVATGALMNIDVRGRDNVSLKDKWTKNLETYLGIMTEGFPNFFVLSGPQSPFANLPVIVDNSADWIGKAAAYMREKGYHSIEPKQDAVEGYCKLMNDIFDATVLREEAVKSGSWFVGANVPGKPVRLLFWFGGVSNYIGLCDAEVADGFPSMKLE